MTWIRNFFGRFTLSRQAPRVAVAPQPFTLVVSAPISVYDRSVVSGALIRDPDRLRTVEQARCEEWFADYLSADEDLRGIAKVLSGGELTFRYDPRSNSISLRIEFGAARRLSAEELSQLREYVHGQLLDGIGEGFQQAYAYGRTYAEQQRGMGSRMWLDFVALKSRDLTMEVLETRS
jgi:hypothetical protein